MFISFIEIEIVHDKQETPMRVLFVCLGNICRSPAAEGVFRHIIGGAATTDSAGTSDWHIGNPPYGPMLAATAARGYDISDLQARQFTARDFEEFDLIIGMDAENIANMERLRPAENTTPMLLFTDYADTDDGFVPDPYYTGDYTGALDLIENAATGLANTIAQQRTKT